MGGLAPTLIVVPVLARPHRVLPLMDAVSEATEWPHRLLFVVSESDNGQRAALEAAHADHLVVADQQTSYPAKCNAAWRASTEPWLFLAADDITPHRGWLAEAHRVQAETGALVVGTNDLSNRRTIEGTHSTHTLVARSYCDEPGATGDAPGVLHEGYHHWYCDDELVEVAKARGVWAHAGDSIVEHHHPYHGKGEMDATYRKGESRKRHDRATFMRRRRLWR